MILSTASSHARCVGELVVECPALVEHAGGMVVACVVVEIGVVVVGHVTAMWLCCVQAVVL